MRKEKNEITLKNYIEKYILQTMATKSYELNDILQIAAFVLNKGKNELYIDLNQIYLDHKQIDKLTECLDRLYVKHIPLQYILGFTSFYNEQYIVNNSVLIPRSDSEVLVKKAIEYISCYNLKTMIDMCTGSGCIGISTKKNSDIDMVYLVDISTLALDVAKKNMLLNLENESGSIKIINSDLFSYFITNNIGDIDIIVSNPPYIKTKDIANLDESVKCNEPLIALDGGKDGMAVYKKILIQAKNILKDGGFLILEIGFDELELICKLISNHKEYSILEKVKDLGRE